MVFCRFVVSDLSQNLDVRIIDVICQNSTKVLATEATETKMLWRGRKIWRQRNCKQQVKFDVRQISTRTPWCWSWFLVQWLYRNQLTFINHLDCHLDHLHFYYMLNTLSFSSSANVARNWRRNVQRRWYWTHSIWLFHTHKSKWNNNSYAWFTQKNYRRTQFALPCALVPSYRSAMYDDTIELWID